jgi:hypothetical protein
MLYHVLKLKMSDETIQAVNAKGWGSTLEGRAYAAMRNVYDDDADLAEKALAAAVMGLYHHGLTVKASSVDAVFEYDNSPFKVDATPIYHCKGLSSMSVGDVVIAGPEALVCCNTGWKALPEHAYAAFLRYGQDVACQRPNALEAAA